MGPYPGVIRFVADGSFIFNLSGRNGAESAAQNNEVGSQCRQFIDCRSLLLRGRA